MSDACPAPGPDDPLVRSLMGTVDCHVQLLIHSGYDGLFQPSGAFAPVLSAVLVVYVAFIGYRLLLGRSQLNITDFALTAIKLGAVLALTTQWATYQGLVYHFLFYGPQQVADVILHQLNARGAGYNGDVFDGLQRAFADLTAFSPANPAGAAPMAQPATNVAAPAAAAAATMSNQGALSTLLSKSGFDSLLLLISAVILLVSSLGVLLAAKVVLGLLLAVGPLFIALLLFDSTRGVFEGWLRASLAFAFAPLAITVMLGLALSLLDPTLQQLETMRDSNTYVPGVAFAALLLVLVFAGVALGMAGAAGMIAGGFKLPGLGRSRAAPATAAATGSQAQPELRLPARSDRTANAVAAQARRDARMLGPDAGLALAAADRRITLTSGSARAAPQTLAVTERLGQAPRRNTSPRAARSGVRSE